MVVFDMCDKMVVFRRVNYFFNNFYWGLNSGNQFIGGYFLQVDIFENCSNDKFIIVSKFCICED